MKQVIAIRWRVHTGPESHVETTRSTNMDDICAFVATTFTRHSGDRYIIHNSCQERWKHWDVKILCSADLSHTFSNSFATWKGNNHVYLLSMVIINQSNY